MLKTLHIYMPFAKNELKRCMAYEASFYLFAICTTFGSFISYYLWMAIYGSATSSTLGGLTKNEMIIYVFMTYVTSALVTVSIADFIGEDVTKGTVAMNLIKPIDYRLSLISRALGTVIYRLIAPAIFIWIGLEIYKVSYLHMTFVSPLTLLTYLVSTFMSILIYVLFDFCFGMIAFFTTYIFGLMITKAAVLSFLTGQLIPLSFFPDIIQQIFNFLPFSSMVYTPVMIYLGKYSGASLLFVLGRQFVWIVILYVLGSIIWNQVTKRLVVLGG